MSEFSFSANMTHSPSNIGHVVGRQLGGSKYVFLPVVGEAYSATNMFRRQTDDESPEHTRCLFCTSGNQRRRM
jgi:hypothetical protein